MKALLLKANGTAIIIDPNNIKEIQNAIECRTFDIVRGAWFTHGGTHRGPDDGYDLFVDDDGLHDESLAVNALALWYFGIVLVGNVMVAEHDGPERAPYTGPFVPNMRPEPGFTFVPLPEGPTPKGTDAEVLHRPRRATTP